MNHRERFLNLFKGNKIDHTPFCPDITTWYVYTRIPFGTEQAFNPGEYIPDGIDFHQKESRLSGKFAKMTFLDYYREYGWGLPIHMYEGVWCRTEYSGGVVGIIDKQGRYRRHIFRTPKGDLQKIYTLAADGSWAPTEYPVKKVEDLDIIKYMVEHSRVIPQFVNIEKFLVETDGFGVCDVVVHRSPFGKLIHELIGFINTVYALNDHPNNILDFMQFQEYYDLELVRLAAESPAWVVMISDHADENLISPPHYRKFCIPFYQKACGILHKKNRIHPSGWQLQSLFSLY